MCNTNFPLGLARLSRALDQEKKKLLCIIIQTSTCRVDLLPFVLDVGALGRFYCWTVALANPDAYEKGSY